MPRTVWIALGSALAFFLLLWVVTESPRSIGDSLLGPLRALAGSGQQLHSTLLDVSETAEPVRSVSRRLFQPLGTLTLVRVHPALEDKSSSK